VCGLQFPLEIKLPLPILPNLQLTDYQMDFKMSKGVGWFCIVRKLYLNTNLIKTDRITEHEGDNIWILKNSIS